MKRQEILISIFLDSTEIVDNQFRLPLDITDDATVEKINVALEVNNAVIRGQQVVKSVTYNGTVPLWLSLVRVNEGDNNSESSEYYDHHDEPREWRKVEGYTENDLGYFSAWRPGTYRVYYCFYQGDNEPSPDTQGMELPYTITVNGFTQDILPNPCNPY